MVLASLAWREVAQCCSWKQFLQVAVGGTGPFFPRQWSTVISCQQRRRQHASFQQAAPHSRHLLPAPACARLCCWKKAAQQWRQRSSPARGTRVSRRSAKCAPKQCAMECGIQVLAHTVLTHCVQHCVNTLCAPKAPSRERKSKVSATGFRFTAAKTPRTESHIPPNILFETFPNHHLKDRRWSKRIFPKHKNLTLMRNKWIYDCPDRISHVFTDLLQRLQLMSGWNWLDPRNWKLRASDLVSPVDKNVFRFLGRFYQVCNNSMQPKSSWQPGANS